MAQTSVQSNALHPLHVLTNALVEEICILLGGLTVFDITLTIEHPGWDLNCSGLLITATILFTSSVVNSPARLFMSMSHFLQTMLEMRRPIPRMAVKAYITFCRPSTFVLHIRRMCWKFCDWN